MALCANYDFDPTITPEHLRCPERTEEETAKGNQHQHQSGADRSETADRLNETNDGGENLNENANTIGVDSEIDEASDEDGDASEEREETTRRPTSQLGLYAILTKKYVVFIVSHVSSHLFFWSKLLVSVFFKHFICICLAL
jgi:hypothetical protein